MAALETHTYDHKLRNYAQRIESDIKTIPWLVPNILPFSQAIEECKLQLSATKEEKGWNKDHAMKTLDLFASGQGNHDGTNDLNVETIFPVIWAAVRSLRQRGMTEKDVELTTLGFWEQLADVTGSGSCPQGRVARLLNLYGLLY